MNKKFMTLGVAAAVGLAGFAALPVLAATFEKTDIFAPAVKSEGSTDAKGSLTVTKKIVYSGKISGATANQTVENKDDVKNFILGVDTKKPVEIFYTTGGAGNNDGLTEGNAAAGESGAITEAKKAANVGIEAAEGKKELNLSGASFTHSAAYLKNLAAEIKSWKKEDKKKAEGLKVNVSVIDNSADFTLLKTDLDNFIAAVKDSGMMISVDFASDDVKTMNATAVVEILPVEINKISINKKFDSVKVKNSLYIGELKKISGLGAGYVLDETNAMIDKNGFDSAETKKPEIKPEDDKKNDNKKNEENAAGNKDKAADKGKLKAPDTGIVK